jgi:GNAT superfamily N-acetyltransferase
MEIRIADHRDADAVADLVLALLVELSGNEPSGYSQPALANTARVLLDEQAIVALLAEEGGKPIWVAILNPCASLYAGRFAEITELYVKPEFRSAGIGGKLLEAAIGVARRRSWSRVEVGTPELPAWARTAAFYKRNGFVEVGARMKLPLQPHTVEPRNAADSR